MQVSNELKKANSLPSFFVAFDYSQDAMAEIQALMKRSGKMIRAITVQDILDEQVAYKLA